MSDSPRFALLPVLLTNGEDDFAIVNADAIISVEPHDCTNPDDCRIKAVLYLQSESEVTTTLSVYQVGNLLATVGYIAGR